ncbi:hypothetical protein [Virgibacillus salinus]|uniref:Uncharacterized protein n=1 Tax=Virgibacillus salinus TaxID=553311 RepID=A0A1H0XV58_9BACI|nr:hypothetical protein [Virgibacillus salinus]SDQ06804.1 hypothetical protein SAMN05216231_0233 [Virgibacillus salinus]
MEKDTSVDYQYDALVDILSEMVTTYLTNNNSKGKGSRTDDE